MADTANPQTQPIVPYSLDDYFQSTPVGSVERALTNNLYGIDFNQTPGLIPMNKDSYGLTFFVRPQLNLQSDNIRNLRLFYPLLTTNELSIQRYVRTCLDPRMMFGYGSGKTGVAPIMCPAMDNDNAFMPVLTNNLMSISGWPDVTAPTFSSKPGVYEEVYSQVDGIVQNYGQYDIDATFRNVKGDPILYKFYVWLHYMSAVFEGRLMPYPDFIIENEIDYMTRIYRLVLDSEKTYVTKIAATGVAFPISVPMGQFFDFNHERPINDQTKDFTIRFRCLGAIFQDDILVDEFNQTVGIFNPHMRDGLRDSIMVKVPRSLRAQFKNRGYPRINPNNYEFEVWVSRDVFAGRTQAFLQENLADPNLQDQLYTGD